MSPRNKPLFNGMNFSSASGNRYEPDFPKEFIYKGWRFVNGCDRTLELTKPKDKSMSLEQAFEGNIRMANDANVSGRFRFGYVGGGAATIETQFGGNTVETTLKTIACADDIGTRKLIERLRDPRSHQFGTIVIVPMWWGVFSPLMRELGDFGVAFPDNLISKVKGVGEMGVFTRTGHHSMIVGSVLGSLLYLGIEPSRFVNAPVVNIDGVDYYDLGENRYQDTGFMYPSMYYTNDSDNDRKSSQYNATVEDEYTESSSSVVLNDDDIQMASKLEDE
jgi:hypothetical protein